LEYEARQRKSAFKLNDHSFNRRYHFPAPAAKGTDATVAFQDSLPESGQWNFASWKRSVVADCSVPYPVIAVSR